MSDFKQIDKIDPSILDRVSEEDVTAWVAAKLQSLKPAIPASCLSVTMHDFSSIRGERFSLSWSLHAADKCSGTSPDVATAFRTVRQELLNRPKERAADIRAKANSLLKEAAQLEELSAKTA